MHFPAPSPHTHPQTFYFKQRATEVTPSCMHKSIQCVCLSSSFQGEGSIHGGREEKKGCGARSLHSRLDSPFEEHPHFRESQGSHGGMLTFHLDSTPSFHRWRNRGPHQKAGGCSQHSGPVSVSLQLPAGGTWD